MKHQVIATADVGTDYPIMTLADLRNVLSTLAKSERLPHPVLHLAIKGADNGPALMIGVHHDRGALYWLTNSRDDAIATGGTNERPVMYGANQIMMPAFTELSITTVLAAAEQFVSTGNRPTAVTWSNYHDAMRQLHYHRSAS